MGVSLERGEFLILESDWILIENATPPQLTVIVPIKIESLPLIPLVQRVWANNYHTQFDTL
jgi:hypothetical protein